MYVTGDNIIGVRDYIYAKYGVLANIDNVTKLVMQDYIVEEKYDGYSYLNVHGKFFSKRLSQAKGNEGMPIEKTGHLPHLSAILSKVFMECGCDLHGEIYIPGGISDDITKILGCTEDEAVRRINSNWDNRPRYMLIDIRQFNDIPVINEPYYIRRILLEHMYYKHIAPLDPNYDIVLTEILNGDPRDEFSRIVHSGGEGIIMKRTKALYLPDKKPTDNWVKGKKSITADVVITGYNEGTGKNKDMFGSITFGMYFDDVGFKECGSCSSGLDDATRAKLAANPDAYLGTVMEIDAIQESVKSFRNAVFIRLRDDKNAESCFASDITINDKLV